MKACIFCAIATGETASSVIFRTEGVVAFLDISPVNPGHILVIPTRHVSTITELNKHEVTELALATRQAAAILKTKLEGCIGVSISLADGEGAGQEVPHVHFHIIPRFPSDDFGWRRYGCRMERSRLEEIALTLRRPNAKC